MLLDDIDSDAGNHNGGWIDFGPLDGKLYVSVGDGGAVHTKSQDLRIAQRQDPAAESRRERAVRQSVRRSLRRAARGVRARLPESVALPVPSRRPSSSAATSARTAGRRSTGSCRVATTAGPPPRATFDPAHVPAVRPSRSSTYSHVSVGGGASITGGDFGSETSFPGDYQQSYFFGDYVVGIHPPRGARRRTASALPARRRASRPCLRRDRSARRSRRRPLLHRHHRRRAASHRHHRIEHAAGCARDGDALAGAPAAHRAVLERRLHRRRTATRSACCGTSATAVRRRPRRTYAHVHGPGRVHRDADRERRACTEFRGPTRSRCRSRWAVRPSSRSRSRSPARRFQGGQTITIAGNAIDAEDGTLPPSALVWESASSTTRTGIPISNDVVGSPQSFVTATTGETSANVWYRIFLRATDSASLTGEASVDILPRVLSRSARPRPRHRRSTIHSSPRRSSTRRASFTAISPWSGVASGTGTGAYCGHRRLRRVLAVAPSGPLTPRSAP